MVTIVGAESTLDELLRGMGREPPKEGDMKSLLTTSKMKLGGLIGDKAITQAMKTNEDDTNTAHDRAVNFKDAPPQAHATPERNRDDERRHRDWTAEALGRLWRGQHARGWAAQCLTRLLLISTAAICATR